MVEAQKADLNVELLYKALKAETRELAPEVFQRHWEDLCLIDGVIRHKPQGKRIRAKWNEEGAIVTPVSERAELLKFSHERARIHAPVGAMTTYLPSLFWWPGITTAIADMVQSCEVASGTET